jgi:hypothetical protein
MFTKKYPIYLIILIVAGFTLACMTLYPPWRVSLQLNNRTMSQPYGWAYLFATPDAPDEWTIGHKQEPMPPGYNRDMVELGRMFMDELDPNIQHRTSWDKRIFTINIDFSILFLEWMSVILLAGMLAIPFYLKERKINN